MIARRALPLLALPALAQAQPRMRRLGLLSVGRVPAGFFRAIALPELAREGFVEGRNLDIIARVSEGIGSALQMAARELLAQRPELIAAFSFVAAEAVFGLDPTMPMVMFGSTPPVGGEFARSYARPGGSVTGVLIRAQELNAKRLELATDAFPASRRFGLLAGLPAGEAELAPLRALAERRGVALLIGSALSPDAPGAVIEGLAAAGAEVIVVGASPLLAANIDGILAVTTRRGLPTLCEWRYLAEAGCTLSYGPEHVAIRRRHAQLIARVLRGEHPSTIPIELADRVEFVVNMRAARASGLELPVMVMARADEIIE